jgi:beta-lactamase regulating signal transducer with metallopeptidase domain
MSFAFLWEMSWKSAAIIAAALALAALLRSRSPADRAAVLRLGVSLLLLLPAIALFLPALQIETAAEPIAPLPVEAYVGAETAPMEIAALQPVPTTIWDDPSSLIAILYLGGLLMVALRIGAGLITLRRWTREASPVTDPAWLGAMERARPAGAAGERVRLLVSDEADAPLSWGWLRPVIMLDRDTLDRPEDADAILAHEVAHIVRRDWPALMMTRASVALFWFNPLAWLLEREVVQQAEEAADLSALAQVEPTQYAQTLVSCARHSRTAMVPANSMAPRASGLRRRVFAILEGRHARSGSFWTVAAMLGCAGFAAPLAAIELVPAVAEMVEAPEAPEAPKVPETPIAPVRAGAPAAPVALAALAAQPAPLAPLTPLAPVRPARAAAPSEQVVEVPAIDVDVPETRVHVPEINVDVEGVRVNVPAVNVVAPRVRVNVPPIKVRLPQLASVSLPASIALSAAHPHGWSAEDRAEFEREMREVRREAHREAARARAEARAEAHAESRTRIIEARREARQAHHRSMVKGADGMERGADGMVRGARSMEREADKLRDPAYRERQIARARAEGRTVTHQELIDAIPKLRAGARKMLAGAEKMRASAERMRRSGTD